MPNAVDHRGRFARSGYGKHQGRSLMMAHNALLGIGQIGEAEHV
jgi:hypothetical protein